jgi:hypothetical protein
MPHLQCHGWHNRHLFSSSSSSIPFSNCYFFFTALLTGRADHVLEIPRGLVRSVRLQPSLDTFLSRHYGALHRLLTSLYPITIFLQGAKNWHHT